MFVFAQEFEVCSFICVIVFFYGCVSVCVCARSMKVVVVLDGEIDDEMGEMSEIC